MKKLLRPVLYVSEWVLFLYVLIFIFVFNMSYFANMIIIDTPWEKPTMLPFTATLLFIVAIGLICFLYSKYLIGNKLYKKIKVLLWGLLYVSNLVGCLLWFGISYNFGLSNQERILLIIAIIVSTILIIQIAIKSIRRSQ